MVLPVEVWISMGQLHGSRIWPSVWATQQPGRRLKMTALYNTCFLFSSQIWDEESHFYIKSEDRICNYIHRTDVQKHLPSRSSLHQSHLQEWSKPSWPLKMGLAGCPKTSANSYQHTLHNNPKERRSHLHSGGSLKSYKLHQLSTLPWRDELLNNEIWLIV